ncbi:MAG: hypothetical protein OHK0029_01620 [Armatimonadaceae bacterium]
METNFSKSDSGLYFVHSLDGNRYGPVSREILLIWQEEGRLLPDMMLEADGAPQSFLVRDVIPVVQEREPLPPLAGPVLSAAPSWYSVRVDNDIHEYHAHTQITPAEAAAGTTCAILAEGASRLVVIPPALVGPGNPRIKYRMRNEGLQRQDGSSTDLILFLEYSTEAVSSPRLPIAATGQRRIEAQASASGTSPSAPAAPGSVPSTTLQISVSRAQAAQGGELTVALPDGVTQQTVYLPPGLDRLGRSHRLAFPEKGAPLPGGGNATLRLLVTITD